MATVTNKREVLSMEVKTIREIKNGKKKADMCQEFGMINCSTKQFGKRQNCWCF
jgi:hypothetical protein